ncbi:MAG: ATP-binding cassette domain-containing protein, partial [Planctomycetota bacterium]
MSLLEVKNLSKSFPGVRALSDVSLTLEKGEVLSVIGENGAGKSTLMKILAGVQVQDRGQILIDGKTTSFTSTKNSMDQGIVLIHQELNLCDNLTVGQNIFLGHEPQNRFGFLRFSKIASLTKQYLERVGLEVSHSTVVGNLTIG